QWQDRRSSRRVARDGVQQAHGLMAASTADVLQDDKQEWDWSSQKWWDQWNDESWKWDERWSAKGTDDKQWVEPKDSWWAWEGRPYWNEQGWKSEEDESWGEWRSGDEHGSGKRGTEAEQAGKPQAAVSLEAEDKKLKDSKDGKEKAKEKKDKKEDKKVKKPCPALADCPMDPIQAWKLQQARLGSKEKTLEELRSSQARWSVAFDMSDEDQDGLITESECSKAFKRILGANAEMPKYRLKEMFDEMDVLGKQRLDFRQFHKLAAELSKYMADNPKWAKEEEDKAEKEEKLKQQQLRERAKSDASDVFAILGIAKSKDVQETEQRKNMALKQANEAKEMLKAAGQQVLEPKHARDPRGRRFTSDGTTSPTKKPVDDPGSPSARITSVTVNRRAGRTGGRRATVDPSAGVAPATILCIKSAMRRSRSPRLKVDTVKLTSQIAGFGRYPANRPPGLRVRVGRECSSMEVQNLMDCWGDAAGFTTSEVLQAIRKHMLRDHGSGGSLRFGIAGNENEGLQIQVFPSQRAGSSTPRSTPRSTPCSTPRSNNGRGGWMKEEDGDADRREVPVPGRLRLQRRATSGSFRAPAECGDAKMSKWISWVLRAGYQQLGIRLWDGWLELDAVKDDVPWHMGRFGKGELEGYIRDIDIEGRFDFWNGWLKKVPHDRRQPRNAGWVKAEEKEEQDNDDRFSELEEIDKVVKTEDLPKLHLQGYGHACFALRFSPDDLQLAGAYLDGGLRVFDVARAQHLHTLNLSPRNLARDEEKDDMEAAAEKAALERGKRLSKRGTAMLNLRWLSAGRTANIVATVDTAGTVGFWEVTRGGGVKILAEMPGESELGALSFSEGGDKLLVGGQERVVKVFDVEQLKSSKGRDMKEELCLGSKDAMVGDKPCRHSLKIMSLRSVPEHQHLFLSGGMDRSVLLWDLRTPKAPSAWISGVELSGDSLDISCDGNTVLAGSHRSLNPLQLFDLRLLKQADESEKKAGLTMTAVQTYQWSGDASEKAAQPSCMVFQAGWDSFDNTTIAAAGEKENQARIFERPKNGGPLRILSSLEGYSRAFYSASVSSDGRTAAFGSSDGSIVISNVRIM
ncbi:pfs-2, partial [Symbiodinium necroappetens]